jgi:hypothetical protein
MEVKEALYSVVMTLTIQAVRPMDFGNYTCVARNSKGTVKGTVELQSKLAGKSNYDTLSVEKETATETDRG